jgi:hypothetical protein
MGGYAAVKVVPRVLVVLFTMALCAPIQATPSLQTAFISAYPAVADSKLDNCATCHMPVEKDFLNTFGLDMKEAKLRFKDIEGKDSDGDGKTNLEEILALTLPGSFAKFPEYYLFHNKKGTVHFNHETHVANTESEFPGACKTCHGADKFPRRFDDRQSQRENAHRICIRCHKRSGKEDAPTRCKGCHEAEQKDDGDEKEEAKE